MSSVIVLPVLGSIGSMPVSFALRFGFDAIFAAIGFNGVAVDAARVEVDVNPACLQVDREPAVLLRSGLPDVDFACLPTVVGFPVLRVVVATGLPPVVGLPVLCVPVLCVRRRRDGSAAGRRLARCRRLVGRCGAVPVCECGG